MSSVPLPINFTLPIYSVRPHGFKAQAPREQSDGYYSRTVTDHRGLRTPLTYSPDFNPIEKVFARLKAMLRKAGERTVSGLWRLIGSLVDLFRPDECANYFSACGYDPD